MKTTNLSKAIFLDRDGTIIKEVPSKEPVNDEMFGYITDISQVSLIDGSAKGISLARNLGYKTIIVSNQSAIARGRLTEEKLFQINDEMYRQLKEQEPNAQIDDFFYSPFHIEGIIERFKKNSLTRKPNIGMILEATEKHNISLQDSYLIGDSYADVKCAENAGIKKILVLTGYGNITYRKCLDEGLKINFIADNLFEAVKFIERQEY